MSQDLKLSAKKVQDFLIDNGFQFEVKEFTTSTRTAQDAANSLGCEVGQIAKSLIFEDAISDDAVLIIASGKNMVDIKKVEKAFNFKLKRANADFVREKTGFAIGGVPPVAHKNKLLTILDEDLLKYEQIFAAAGTPNCVFGLKSSDLEKLTGGSWLDLSQN